MRSGGFQQTGNVNNGSSANSVIARPDLSQAVTRGENFLLKAAEPQNSNLISLQGHTMALPDANGEHSDKINHSRDKVNEKKKRGSKKPNSISTVFYSIL